MENVKKTCEQAQSLRDLALSHQSDGSPGSLNKAIRIFREIEVHCRDRENNGYYEVYDWVPCGNPNEDECCKSTGTHLCILAAYTALYKVWKAPELETRLRSLIFIFTNKILNPDFWHLMACFNEVWDVTDSTVSRKRDIEAGSMLIEAAEALNDEKVLKGIQNVALKIAMP